MFLMTDLQLQSLVNLPFFNHEKFRLVHKRQNRNHKFNFITGFYLETVDENGGVSINSLLSLVHITIKFKITSSIIP